MATTAKGRKIEATNIGKVKNLSLTLPDGGGFLVLKGRNGTGKTTTLNAVNALITGSGAVPKRDGTLRGEITGLGATITVQKSARRKGELEVTSLEGKLSLSDLVDPGIADPVAADARRIKALVGLAPKDPGAEMFYDLAESPEEFGNIVGDELEDCGDVLARTGRVKRCFEKAAREAESTADRLSGKLERLSEELKPLEGLELPDPNEAQRRLDELLVEAGQLNAETKAADKAREVASLARKKLETIDQNVSVEQERRKLKGCKEEETRATVERNAAERLLREAEERFRSAEQEFLKSRAATAAAEAAVRSAEALDEALNQLHEQIVIAEQVTAPSPDRIENAQRDLDAARAQLQNALALQSLAAKRPDLERLSDQHLCARSTAERYRKAASAAEAKLTELVAQPGSPLRVEDGRLVLDTERGVTPFCELSEGERWKIALTIALPQIGPEGLVVLKQEAFQGLDPIARSEIAEHARSLGVTIITAECTADDEITTEAI